ncbi:MAG: hypothetical protein ATN34_04505 [Epulopiscium sp. Nele67-Bin002]|nr:MAG: hypothetical protein ATN33_02330 [Epulopiscium sp. Nele67-Bin001]OON91830.1 MAG: hypothetical protein ATN34_04505 [Epulopiscium sp. Nele67-Bin002]
MGKIINFGMILKNRFMQHNIGPRSAQMSYYWILSVFPFLLMIINLLSYANIDWQVLLEYLSGFLPDLVSPIVDTTIKQMLYGRSTTGIYLGAIISLWSTSAAVNVLIKGIYIAYGVVDRRNFVLRKIIGMIYALVLAFLIIAMMVLLVFGNKVGAAVLSYLLKRYPTYYNTIWDWTRTLSSCLVMLLGSFCIHRVIPRKHILSRSLWPGVFFTTATWYLFSVAFSVYVDSFSNYSAMYGSIGGIFVLLIWIYTNGLFILMGAEVNAMITMGRIESDISHIMVLNKASQRIEKIKKRFNKKSK